jgi:ABC-type lipoprotein export system ATPase subunit
MNKDGRVSEKIDSCLLRIRNVGRRFGEKTIWIDEIDIPRGKITSVIGASGSGKSTLLHMIGGLARPDFQQERNCSGRLVQKPALDVTFFVDGRRVWYNLCDNVPRDFRERVGFVFQSPYLLQSATASANIALGAFCARRSICAETMREIASNLEINPHFLSYRSNIRSGGERQRLALARALARNPNLVLADEPTANLDPKLAEDIVGLLSEWSGCASDRTTIWVTHDVRLAAEFADAVVVLNEGRLAAWTTWPQENPGDPKILRKWIDGEPAAARPSAVGATSPRALGPRAEDGYRSGGRSLLTTQATRWQRIRFWAKIGLAQIFDGASADQVRLLRQWTSVAVLRDSDARSTSEDNEKSRLAAGLRLWRSFSATASVLRLALFLTIMIALWAELDALAENIRDSLLTPTLNPIVTSSRNTINDQAVNEARELLATQARGASEFPDAFGRYEFDHRRVSALRDNSALIAPRQRCLNAQERMDREVQMDIAGVDPGEPLLRRLPLESGPNIVPEHVGISDRFDGLWSILLSRTAEQKLVRIVGAPARARFVCMEVRGSWLTGEIVGFMNEAPRGRFGPYDIIMSATQWRDFGGVRDREYYQSAVFYFDADPERSRELVGRVRARALEVLEPPNTRLIQSLANEASFERISAALERNSFSKIIVGFLGLASLLVLILVVCGFVSESFRSNLKAICVALALGASFFEIAIVEIVRILLVILPTALMTAIAILVVAGYQSMHLSNAAALASWGVGNLLGRFGLAIWGFAAGVLVVTLAMSGWWLIHIRGRSLTDQLKELD